MPTYTSSSNERLPSLRFGRIWSLIAISLVMFIIIWDGFWVSKKVVPLPDDDANLWAYHRRRVAREGNEVVVLVGSSRIQAGLDQAKFTELTGLKTVQLAIVGESPIPVLQNLAEDGSFKGTVICDLSEFIAYQSETGQQKTEVVREWLKSYQESKTSDDFEFWLRGFARYILARPHLGNNPPDALKNIITGQAFETISIDQKIKNVHPTFFDRTLIFNVEDFLTKEEKERLIEISRKDPVNAMKYIIEHNKPRPERFLELANKVEGYVQQIQSRSGKVIIINFPMSGELERLNEIAFPREQFWDVLASRISATTIHYKDYPQLQFECPDYSHIDAKDTPIFTENLVNILMDIDNKFLPDQNLKEK